MEEKKQKKIKASPRPGKLAGYVIGLKKYREKLPSPGRSLPLMEEKEAKEDQGLTEAGEVVRIRDRS